MAWLATGRGRTAADAVDHFWPGASPDRRRQLLSTVRSWKHRARPEPHGELHVLPRPAGEAPSGEDDAVDDERPRGRKAAGGLLEALGLDEPELPPRPAPDTERPKLVRIVFLEWQLSELLADLAWAREQGNFRAIKGLDERVTDVRTQLDQAREAAGGIVALERDLPTVAAELEKRRPLIEKLHRALMERSAREAAEAARKRDL